MAATPSARRHAGALAILSNVSGDGSVGQMTESDWRNLLLLGLFWLGYFVLHSALAALPVKNWFASQYPKRMPFYRLGFNVVALLTLLPLCWLFDSPALWAWRGVGAWLANGIALAVLIGFVATLKDYDGQVFMGLRQWRDGTRQVEDPERFHLSPLHRHVRHPWYCLSLALLWTRDMNAAMLLSCVMMTVYFIVGSRLEEGKLVAAYGHAYRRYMARVPGLVPLPWRSISAREAAELVDAAALPRRASGPQAGFPDGG
jgi:methanethiol S-methyltransferase